MLPDEDDTRPELELRLAEPMLSSLLPLRLLGSRSQFSERPMFWPKLALESLLLSPLREDVSRFTSPAEVEPVFLLSLSRSRLSIASSLILSGLMPLPNSY
jgi:hypothetical protein